MSVARREGRANRARPRPTPDSASAPAPAVTWRGWVALALALVALTLVVYAPVWRHGFLNWDDPEYVTENVEVLRRP